MRKQRVTDKGPGLLVSLVLNLSIYKEMRVDLCVQKACNAFCSRGFCEPEGVVRYWQSRIFSGPQNLVFRVSLNLEDSVSVDVMGVAAMVWQPCGAPPHKGDEPPPDVVASATTTPTLLRSSSAVVAFLNRTD